jgi:acetyl-CoA synthetase
VVGDGRCPIVDTWWQTETGAHMITPLPGATRTEARLGFRALLRRRAGAAGRRRQRDRGPGSGYLVVKSSWPSQIRSVYGDHQRMVDTYFKNYPGYYFTGDGAMRDEDGYYWITGRVDDVLNVSGHRMGTAEVESALVLHDKIAEAAVVGFPHDVKGQGIYCYVTPMEGVEPDDAAQAELSQALRQGNRPHRQARHHPVGAGSAENPLRQDHAPHPAQDRRKRTGRAG